MSSIIREESKILQSRSFQTLHLTYHVWEPLEYVLTPVKVPFLSDYQYIVSPSLVSESRAIEPRSWRDLGKSCIGSSFFLLVIEFKSLEIITYKVKVGFLVSIGLRYRLQYLHSYVGRVQEKKKPTRVIVSCVCMCTKGEQSLLFAIYLSGINIPYGGL